MKNKQNSIALAFILSIGTAFTGCGGGGGSDIEVFSFTSPSDVNVNIGDFTAVDVDANDPESNNITYSLSGTDADKFTINSTNGEVSFKAEATPGSYHITVTATAGEKSISQNITVNVVFPTNHAPVIKNPDSVNVNENQYNAISVDAKDDDNDPLTYAIVAGSDADDFLINSESGLVVFKTPPVYERKDKYTLTVSASDGIDTTTKEITINILNVTDTLAPVIATMSGVTVDENQKYAVDIDAIDVNGEVITYSIEEGADADSFDIDPATGVVTFKTAPDYETKNSYTFTAGATNSVGSTTKTITVSINDLDGGSLVFRTGQTQTYKTGDDGDYEAGRNRSFTIHKNDQTLTENITKVTWKNNDFLHSANHLDAVKYCNAITHGGYDDWRLPTIDELTNLADRGIANYFGPFNIIKPDNYYWSNTPYARETNQYYTFGFDLGEDAVETNDKIKYVACVRKESTTDANPLAKRFTKYEDIITDTKTKLQWYDPKLEPVATAGTWDEALAGCNNLIAGGKDDWRLPNINELISIVDRSKSSGDAFFDIFDAVEPNENAKYTSTYFSSTTNSDYVTRAWGFNFTTAKDIASISKTLVKNYRCVRTLGD